jgi:hypothetical protein
MNRQESNYVKATKHPISARHAWYHCATHQDTVKTHVQSCSMRLRQPMILVLVAVKLECENIKTRLHPLHESDMRLTFPTADQSLPQFHYQGGSGQKRIQRIVV